MSFFCYFKNIGGHYESWETRVPCPVVLYGLDQGKQDLTSAKWSYHVGLKGEAKDVVFMDNMYYVEWMEGSLIAQKKKSLTWHKFLDSEFSAGEIRAIIVPGNPAPIAVGSTCVSNFYALNVGLYEKALRISHHYRDALCCILRIFKHSAACSRFEGVTLMLLMRC
ncbi:beta-galactosidase 3-like protein [Tanacetum coccineum]|uniref:Beta-galactosidase 3-like protein n=1 Tax=Tanacetum coccineum TaxID=301880 RepID=A0ABQ5IT29_9ASTR